MVVLVQHDVVTQNAAEQSDKPAKRMLQSTKHQTAAHLAALQQKGVKHPCCDFRWQCSGEQAAEPSWRDAAGGGVKLVEVSSNLGELLLNQQLQGALFNLHTVGCLQDQEPQHKRHVKQLLRSPESQAGNSKGNDCKLTVYFSK